MLRSRGSRTVLLGAAIAPLFTLAGASCQGGGGVEPEFETTHHDIVGGSTAPGLAYPWMARISWRVPPAGGNPAEWKFACGGSLIAADWVLTAAHCVAERVGNAIVAKPLSDVQVVMGEYNLDVVESTEQARAPAQIIVHPGYVPAVEPDHGPVKEFNDIALIHLAAPVQLNNFARVLELASENDDAGMATVLSGWGEDDPGTDAISAMPTTLLKQLEATVVDPDEPSDPDGGCNAHMLLERSVISTQRAIDSSTELCTLNDETGPDDYQSACYKDSGSPWVIYNDGCAEQIGLQVFGDLFCVTYDVATRVSAYLPWIREQGVNYVGDRVYEAETMFHATGGAHPEGWNIWDNNYISFRHTFNGGQQEMVVRAAGSNANGWPRMQVSVGGATVYEANVTSTDYVNHTFTFNAPFGEREVQIRFVNDFFQAPLDRNLFIDKAKVKDERTSCGSLDTIVPTLRITNDWGAGYCAEVDVVNTLGLPTASWTVVYDTKDSSVYTSWNPASSNGQGPHSATPTESWLEVIAPGDKRTLGFCANRVGSNTTLPTVVSATATY